MRWNFSTAASECRKYGIDLAVKAITRESMSGDDSKVASYEIFRGVPEKGWLLRCPR